MAVTSITHSLLNDKKYKIKTPSGYGIKLPNKSKKQSATKIKKKA